MESHQNVTLVSIKSRPYIIEYSNRALVKHGSSSDYGIDCTLSDRLDLVRKRRILTPRETSVRIKTQSENDFGVLSDKGLFQFSIVLQVSCISSFDHKAARHKISNGIEDKLYKKQNSSFLFNFA
ncbi:hypothetical protein CDAR_103911 [Caerostris darwini]|uniref:Uncharacterized protein n=1 Tax=Caerostris darwini TaxID=1538125 RepID=A0AAV4M852_9ARAC|nr:hypothetical protein CDAR_103911 [Caerostris darwini]